MCWQARKGGADRPFLFYLRSMPFHYGPGDPVYDFAHAVRRALFFLVFCLLSLGVQAAFGLDVALNGNSEGAQRARRDALELFRRHLLD